MSKEKGYIKSWRPNKDDELYFEEPFTKWQAWHDLCILALYKDKVFLSRGSLIEGKRGCVYASHRFLAERWKWSKLKVERFLRMLEKLGRIDTQTNPQKKNRIGCISILNYNKYQSDKPTDEPTDEPNTNKVERKNKEKTKETIEAKASSSAKADAKAELSREIRDFYNSELDAAKATMPRVRGNITGQRQKYFLARVRENGIDAVKEVIRKAAQSDFLNGGGKTGFTANFEWLMRPANFPKVLDGNYDNREPAKKTTSKNDNGGNSNETATGYNGTDYERRKQADKQERFKGYAAVAAHFREQAERDLASRNNGTGMAGDDQEP